MAITLYNLFESSLLIINAIVILHEERFLAKYGWGRNQALTNQGFGQPQQLGAKHNLMNLIHSIRTVMRIPLIFVNILTLIFKLIAG